MFSNNARRNTFKYGKILSLAICLGVACLLLTGSALAGVTTGPSPLPQYALQVGGAGHTLHPHQCRDFTRTVNAPRAATGNPNSAFYIRVDLQPGFVFAPGYTVNGQDVSQIIDGGTPSASELPQFTTVVKLGMLM